MIAEIAAKFPGITGPFGHLQQGKLPVAAFLAGLERIGPTNAAMLSTLEPVITVYLGAVWLGEKLRPITILGGGLILIAVLLLTRGEVHQVE